MKARDENILRHILDYCDSLMAYTDGITYDDFQKSKIRKDACALCILQIGELVFNLTDEFKREHSQIPWRQIRSMKNIVVHHYGSVDAGTIWETIKEDIPDLKKFCEDILQDT